MKKQKKQKQQKQTTDWIYQTIEWSFEPIEWSFEPIMVDGWADDRIKQWHYDVLSLSDKKL